MAVVVKADYNTVREYTGKGVYTSVPKKQAVYFRLVADDFSLEESIALSKIDSNILVVDYKGNSTPKQLGVSTAGAYVTFTVDMGNDITESDIIKYIDYAGDSVIMFRLPQDYNNIRFLCEMLDKYSNIRFSGCQVFAFDNYRFGYCGKDILSKRGIKYDTTKYITETDGDILQTFELADIELKVNDKSTSGTKHGGTKKAKPSKTSLFNSLLYGDGKVEL